MKSSIEHKLEEARGQEIDMAPLLDVVFILLIFLLFLPLLCGKPVWMSINPRRFLASSCRNRFI